MQKAKKYEVVEELHEAFLASKVVIATDYKGLSVETISELRKRLRESNSTFRVVKNTLLTIASIDTSVEVAKDLFSGPTAVAMNSEDPVVTAKILTDFAKANEKLEIKFGAMDGRVLSVDDIKALSSLPSREVLLAKVLSAMNGVPTSAVQVLAAVPQKFLNLLVALKDKKENVATVA